MEKLGYIKRLQDPGDRKSVTVSLTTEGRRLKGVLVPLAEEVNHMALGSSAEGDIEATRRVLLSMIENAAKDEADFAEAGHTMPSTRDIRANFANSLVARRSVQH
jgi:DNA-binding MarR family transcriptional regulator